LPFWRGRGLAGPVPQAGIGPAGGGLDGAVANQLIDGHPEDPSQGGEVAGRSLVESTICVSRVPPRKEVSGVF